MTVFFKVFRNPEQELWMTNNSRESIISGNKVAKRLYELCRKQARKCLDEYHNKIKADL